MLLNAPTGISWSTIPKKGATPEEQLAEQTNICWRVTHDIDTICNQPLRCTIDTEEEEGPDFYLVVSNNGVARYQLSRWPVLQVVAANWAAATSFPYSWQPIPVNMTSLARVPSSGSSSSAGVIAAAGASAILIAPGYITWSQGRNGYRLQVTYVNGWPHAGITSSVSQGATTLQVDDTSGFAVNMTATVYDGANTEVVTVQSANPLGTVGGPGTLTLAAGTLYDHQASATQPVLISTLPASVQEAAILKATAAALVRGATAITAPAMPGSEQHASKSPEELNVEAEVKLAPFKRVI